MPLESPGAGNVWSPIVAALATALLGWITQRLIEATKKRAEAASDAERARGGQPTSEALGRENWKLWQLVRSVHREAARALEWHLAGKLAQVEVALSDLVTRTDPKTVLEEPSPTNETSTSP